MPSEGIKERPIEVFEPSANTDWFGMEGDGEMSEAPRKNRKQVVEALHEVVMKCITECRGETP